MIKVENLKYKYPLTDHLALNDVSFSVSEGEFVGVIGQNSSGKSTLCQALVGLVPHFYKGSYGGKVWVDGLEVRQNEVSELALTVGIVFQNPFTQVTGSKETVYEEIAFGLENMGLPRDEMRKRIEHSLSLLGILPYQNRNPFDLSGGQMQRMAIAGVLAMQPKIIVLDEPTSQLDPQGADEVFRAISELSRQKMTVILVEHKIEKIAQYCTKILALHDGKLVDFDSPQNIFSRNDLDQLGISAPVYTRICKALALKTKTGYPVTIEQAAEKLKPLWKGR